MHLFCLQLELIPDEGRSNDAITFVVQLEQYLMEGSYSKVKFYNLLLADNYLIFLQVMAAKANCPKQFTYFMEGLVNRIRYVSVCGRIIAVFLKGGLNRDAVAECSEVAYKSLSLSEARRLMDFKSDQEVLDYIGEAEKTWVVKDSTIFFQDNEKPIGSQDIPSMRLITESLQYCVELERIV